MRRVVFAALLVALVPPALAQAGKTPEAGPIITGAIDGFVRPAYAKFHADATKLRTAMTGLCSSPSQAALDGAKAAFGEAIEAWSTVEIIRFGPITQANRLERVLFWPDRKGTGLKQVQAALADQDPTATDAAQLASKSVAMQGFGALEFIVYGTGSEALSVPGDPYRCAYGAAIAGNIEAIAAEVDKGWADSDGFATKWQAPAAGNPFYRDGGEALGELFDVFVNGLELVRDVRLRGFLGDEAAQDKPRQAVFWRSGQTAASLGGNLAGMKALFDASKLGQALPPETAWIAQSIDITLANGVDAAKAAEGPTAEVLADPARRAKLDHLGLVTSSLSNLFGVRLAGELGLSAGFSSLDGD